jgi:hypothetical protein
MESIHPLDLLALQAGTLLTINSETIVIEFPRHPGGDVIASLRTLFDRPGYEFAEGYTHIGCVICRTEENQWHVKTHDGIDLYEVVEILQLELAKHGLGRVRSKYTPAGAKWSRE